MLKSHQNKGMSHLCKQLCAEIIKSTLIVVWSTLVRDTKRLRWRFVKKVKSVSQIQRKEPVEVNDD